MTSLPLLPTALLGNVQWVIPLRIRGVSRSPHLELDELHKKPAYNWDKHDKLTHLKDYYWMSHPIVNTEDF